MAKNYLGIDLGTTETTVSIIEIENQKDKPIEKLKSLDIYQYNAEHEFDRNIKGLQSSIYIDRDNKKVYTGIFAKKLYSEGNRPLNTIRSVKTRIGGESMIDVPLDSDKTNFQSYDMTELTATLLKTVKDSVDKQINGQLDEVTITIPAGFNSDERNATIEAANMAGFPNINLLDEPTAVLLNFLNSGDSFSEVDEDFFDDTKNILVYDIGGGTLDISISAIKDNEDEKLDLKILARSQRMDFGGDDIDKYIASYFLSEFERTNTLIDQRTQEEQATIISRIVSNAEKSKIAFNNTIEKVVDKPKRRERAKESVNFEIIDNLKVSALTLTDKLLQEILAPLLSSNGTFLKPLKTTLQQAKLSEKDIDLVILTGGSGKFYLVEETLRKLFTNVNIVDFTEQSAVSKGASIHSYNQGSSDDLKQVNIQDIMSDSIYVKTAKGFDKIIPHTQKPDSKGIYKFQIKEVTENLELFIFYGTDKDSIYKYKEIAGVFEPLDRRYKNESIDLHWEFTSDKILKIFLNGKELVNSTNFGFSTSELLTGFKLN